MYTDCVSGVGAYDTVGGVWEWVADVADDGRIGDTELPAEGYITQVTSGGVPRTSTTSPTEVLQGDYVWSKTPGMFAVMRGGFYGSRSDGGVFTLHAATPLDFAAPTVGFRCAQSL
jgi:formylglycine-generating enzyme required for sulfatase activity